MGRKFKQWEARSRRVPANYDEVAEELVSIRNFKPVADLDYGDHGLNDAAETIASAIKAGKRIALYGDYDVDGTMSIVSWIWFLEAIGHTEYRHHIPCRFTEGYGLNLNAIKKLVNEDGCEIVITMDTGITAQEEAAWCKENGIQFVCTDHHNLQDDKLPDSIILNPKMHPDDEYQHLCGCGITFVLIRKIAQEFKVAPEIWTDLLAITGMATICDVVPLNGVNHKLAKLGLEALSKTKRPVIAALKKSCRVDGNVTEKDVGYSFGPRINAIGRLEHASKIVEAFVGDQPDKIISHMDEVNSSRKKVQEDIYEEAIILAMREKDAPILFLGGNWHPGVVGIAASKLSERFWRPTWLFQIEDGVCKGSARSIPGFDVTAAMSAADHLFTRHGGHKAAGGFAFDQDKEDEIRKVLTGFAEGLKAKNPEIWQSKIDYDCEISNRLADMDLVNCLSNLRPFGHGFEEPRFCIEVEISSTRILMDKVTGKPRHTAVTVRTEDSRTERIMFFNEVYSDLCDAKRAKFIVSAERNFYMGRESLTLKGYDYETTV